MNHSTSERVLAYYAVACLIGLLCITGCQQQQKTFKHFVSGVTGLKRHVTLYDASGVVIREWTGLFMVEMNGSVATFIDNGKEVKIAGTYIIEEI